MPRQRLANQTSILPPTLEEYVTAFSTAPTTRGSVMRLSSLLARVMGAQLQAALRGSAQVVVGQKEFGGTKRRHHLDAFVFNESAGLQLGLDVKGLNSAESLRKNWNNRIGDFHDLASNHHQKSPHAVIGGVLAVCYDGATAALLKNVERSLVSMSGRRATANALGELEATSLIVIDKAKRTVLPDLPDPDGPLRIEKFASTMATVFTERWE